MTRKWWHYKVAIIFIPRVFMIPMGTESEIYRELYKLDYLKELGVDIVWISPMYPLPFADQGYDISDYYNIDPAFGTLEDMEHLIEEAKKRDMYILMDLVVNHCSDEHEWFEKDVKAQKENTEILLLHRRSQEGELPCNWRSYFGGSVWELLPGRADKQYFHVFHKKQPDLNWENPEVRGLQEYKLVAG